ncbi:MAG: hypothetical protein HOV81_29080 [Kofleriaceae bacterium]|nr:hypothetical protein [Kofleriaceae bacterium]
MSRCATLVTVLALAPATALAEPIDDGYCDFVEGSASATAAPLLGPEVFGQFGYIEQPSFAVNPTDSDNLRAIAGIRYSITNIYAGIQHKARAAADCKRHNALLGLRGATNARALAARLKVYEDAQQEAEKMLADANAAVEQRRMTAQEATATRMRVEDLRSLTATARRDLAMLPPADQVPLNERLTAFRNADAEMERREGKLRKVSAYDINVRVGADKFVEGPNTDIQYFAVAQLGINIGAIWLGNGNDRAAAGRAKYVRSGRDPLGSDVTAEQLRATLEVESKRVVQVTALVGDLDKQLQTLANIPSEDSVRFRQTVWFDWVKAKADLAYLQAHVQALSELVGEYER